MKKKCALIFVGGLLLMSLFSVYYCREFGRDEYTTFEDILETQSSFVDSLKEIVPNAVVLQELNCDIDSNGSTDGILLYEDDKSKTCLAIMLCDSFWEGISLASGCGFTYASKATLAYSNGRASISVELEDSKNGTIHPYSIDISYNQSEKMIEYRIISN